MKRVITCAALLLLLSPASGWAQDFAVPKNIEKLADRALKAVNVTVDGALLRLASKFLSADDPDQKIAKEIVSGLQGIYVRSLEFASTGEYTEADVDSLRALVKAPTWSRMVGVTTKGGEDVGVFFKMDKDRIAGVVVIAAQPRQLTFVNIVGNIDLEALASLSGNFGIPKIEKKDR